MRRLLPVLVAATLGLALSACGGSDGGNADQSSSNDSGSEQVDNTTASGGDTSSGDTSSGDISPGDLGALDECAAVAVAFSSVFAIPMSSFTGSPIDDTQLNKYLADAEQYRDKLPERMQQDFDTLTGAYREWAETVRSLSMTDAEGLEAASAKLQEPEVTEATDRITGYLDESCQGTYGG
jgi:hypothetical protein